MSVVAFPGARRVPPKASLDELLDELELELLRARLAQVNQDTRQAAALFGWWAFKRALVWGLVVWALVSCARAEGKQFYNANGSYAGSSVQRSNGASFYDGSGRYSGSSVQQGSSTRYYDNQGRFSGSTIERGPRR
jgi:hypothetical protein